MRLRLITRKILPAFAIALMMGLTLTACGDKQDDYSDTYDEEEDEDKDDKSGKDDKDNINTDIDLDALNKSVEDIKNLNLGTGTDSSDNDAALADEEKKASEGTPKGELTIYSYVDVYVDGNDLTLIPNGGMSGSTKLINGKDLTGFLDYIDDTVLEEGRKINRELFYDLLATMLVDKDLSSGTDTMEKYMIMACALANNFHDTPVKIKECYLDANNAMDYRYNLNAYGKDDIWLVNYGKRTIYFNDGATEYVSDMFKDEYMAYWLMAIDDYYGIDSLGG